MKTDLVTIIGYVAGVLTTLAYLPQVMKIWRSKSSKDISMGMVSLMWAGIFLWFIYGLLIQSYPIILANLVTLLLITAVLILTLRHR